MSDENFEEKSDTVSCRSQALVVDFDFVLMDGINSLREICVDVFKEIGITVDDVTFVRSVLGRRFSGGSCLSRLLGSELAGKTDYVKEAIAKKMDKAIESATPRDIVVKLCKKVLGNNLPLVFITSASPAVADKIIEDLDLLDASAIRLSLLDYMGEYPTEIWLRASRVLKRPPNSCIALTATGKSTREALFAGLKTAALTIPLLDYQDYSGADIVKPATSHDLNEIAEMLNQ